MAMAVIWSIWLENNSCIFNQQVASSELNSLCNGFYILYGVHLILGLTLFGLFIRKTQHTHARLFLKF